MKAVIALLSMIGGITLLTMIIMLIFAAAHKFEEFQEEKARKYRIAHRFDNPPLAKCFCCDCYYYKKEHDRDGYCNIRGQCVADCWFCWDAHPDMRRQDGKYLKEDE